jgi:predicted anti-sigma-YlaC factor YlaD
MTCELVRQMLDGVIDREFSLELRNAVIEHTETCADCAAELDALRHTVNLLRMAPTPEHPPEWWIEGTFEKILRQQDLQAPVEHGRAPQLTFLDDK